MLIRNVSMKIMKMFLLAFILLQLISCDMLDKNFRYVRVAKKESGLIDICNKQDLVYNKEFYNFTGEGEILLIFKIKNITNKKLYTLLNKTHYKYFDDTLTEQFKTFDEYYLKNNIKSKLPTKSCIKYYKENIRDMEKSDYSWAVVDITNKLLLIYVNVP